MSLGASLLSNFKINVYNEKTVWYNFNCNGGNLMNQILAIDNKKKNKKVKRSSTNIEIKNIVMFLQ